jgi:hypothetical protein
MSESWSTLLAGFDDARAPIDLRQQVEQRRVQGRRTSHLRQRRMLRVGGAVAGVAGVVVVAAVLVVAAHSRQRPERPVGPPAGSTASADHVRITLRHTLRPYRAAHLTISCAPGGETAVVQRVCAAIAQEPDSFTDATVRPDCWGGISTTTMTVRGTINGKHFVLHQSGMCGPSGIAAWYQQVVLFRSMQHVLGTS